VTHALQSFFWPDSIAILGASPDIHRIRGRLLHQLRENGFPGRILPINPSYQEIEGLRCYPTIGAVGEPIDLALVAIPAAGVAPALEECAKAGVKNTLIISSGFAEEGGTAGEMQAALIEVTKRTGIRACGPNCEGYFNALGRIATTFSPTVEVKEERAAPWSQTGASGSSRNRAASASPCSTVARQRASDFPASSRPATRPI
jgi:acetate---CoA ligase (ADP-forming)